MINEYPKFKRGEVEDVFDKLSKKEKGLIKDYLVYRKARGVSTDDKLKDIRRYILHLRHIIEKDFDKLDLKDLRELLAIINSSHLTNYVQNSIKTDLKNFLKFLFPDWSMKFSNLDDIKLGSNSMNEEKINSKTIYTKEQIDKLIKFENNNFWKAFLLVQFEGGLRTIEARSLKWSDLKLNDDGEVSELNIYATKTQKARTIFVKESTFYLNKLKQEQENLDNKGVYVFHSKQNKDEPIDKSSVSMWFRRLSKKALGVEGWCYLLRHSRATELYRLADENKIAKETAIKFMGHSKDMSYKYTHLDKKAVEKMLKEQVYKIEEIPEKQKHKLQKEVEELRKSNKEMAQGIVDILNRLRKIEKKRMNF